jgi:MFS family permease
VSVFVRWYVLVVMCLVYSVSIADRYVISTVLEPIRLEFHLTDSGVAFLTGVSLALFYVSFGFPMSWIADRTSRRNVIVASLIGWSAMTACFGMARTYWQLLSARVGVGIGEAGGTPSASSLISDFFPAARRPMAMTVFSLGAPIGAWLGANVAGAIADRFGWRSVFLALGLPGILVGVIVLATVKEPRRGRLDLNSDAPAPTFVQAMSFLLQQRSCVHLMIATGLTTLWGWGLMWWTPTFLMRTYSLTVGEVGAITGPVHLFGGTVATILTSWLLGQPWMSDTRRIVWFLGLGIGLATVSSGLIYATHSLAIVKALFWIFIPSIYFYIGPTFGLFNNLAAPGMRAIYCATTLFIQNFANLVIAPQAIGLLSDWFAADHYQSADALRLALLCLVPTGLWAMTHYFFSARDLVADEQRARACVCSPGVT